LNFFIDHLGYEGDQAHKHQRNLPLILRELRLNPENPQLYCLNARELMAEGRFGQAIGYLKRLLRWGECGDYDRSISYHTQIFNAYPKAYLAICLLMRGREKESRRYCDAALNADPGNPKIQRMLKPLSAFYR
jgi:tetratricopeptide (TPR) repeat protein